MLPYLLFLTVIHKSHTALSLTGPCTSMERLNRSFYALVHADQVAIGKGVCFSQPGLGSGNGDVGSWSLTFWVYLLEECTGHMRVLLLRGLDVDQSRQVAATPHPFIELMAFLRILLIPCVYRQSLWDQMTGEWW